jgi:DNA (cytosine-5)-methyltransferase 1
MAGEVRFFDMFCGAGGSARGAVMAGAVPAAALDAWDLAAETYELNFPDAVVYQMKATSLAPQRVAEDVGKVQLILASPECTSHSVAKGNAPRCERSRETAFQVIRFAKVLRPRWIVVENVAPMQRWKRYEEWVKKLKRLGYKITPGVLDAKDYGAPQSRRRLFLLCDRRRTPALPDSTCKHPKTVAGILGRGESKEAPWAFRTLRGEGRATATLVRADRAIAALGKREPFIMVYYGTDGAGGFQTVDRPLRTITTLDRFAFVRPNGKGHEMRMLQPSELAAAMGFPAAHQWPEVARRERIKLIGNAVCPPIMRDIVRALIKSA